MISPPDSDLSLLVQFCSHVPATASSRLVSLLLFPPPPADGIPVSSRVGDGVPSGIVCGPRFLWFSTTPCRFGLPSALFFPRSCPKPALFRFFGHSRSPVQAALSFCRTLRVYSLFYCRCVRRSCFCLRPRQSVLTGYPFSYAVVFRCRCRVCKFYSRKICLSIPYP